MDADFTADPDGPEIRVTCSIQLVESQAGSSGIQLQVESRSLNGLLLVPCELCEAVGESICDSEVHRGPPIEYSVSGRYAFQPIEPRLEVWAFITDCIQPNFQCRQIAHQRFLIPGDKFYDTARRCHVR